MAFNSKLGIWVSRAIVALPGAAGENALFVIAGGAVLVTGYIGRVTTPFGAGPANIRIRHLVGAVVTLACRYTAAANTALNTRLFISGVELDEMIFLDPAVSNGITGLCPDVFQGGITLPGTIQLQVDANMAGGATAWEAFYIPLEPGATMVSA